MLKIKPSKKEMQELNEIHEQMCAIISEAYKDLKTIHKVQRVDEKKEQYETIAHTINEMIKLLSGEEYKKHSGIQFKFYELGALYEKIKVCIVKTSLEMILDHIEKTELSFKSKEEKNDKLNLALPEIEKIKIKLETDYLKNKDKQEAFIRSCNNLKQRIEDFSLQNPYKLSNITATSHSIDENNQKNKHYSKQYTPKLTIWDRITPTERSGNGRENADALRKWVLTK